MTKEKWIEHMEAVSGLAAPSKGGNVEAWIEAKSYHRMINPDCPDCRARIKTRRTTASHKAREQAYRDAGLVKGRTGLGRVIWE